MQSLRQKASGAMSRVLFIVAFLIASLMPAQSGVMLQGFYWNVPSPGADGGVVPYWWDRIAGQANALRRSGFSAIWLPSPLKGSAGGYSNGYDLFDDYDLGSKDQKGTLPTRFGTREKLQRCAAMLRANGLDIYLDMVLNHRNGDDGSYNFRYRDAYGTANAGRFQKSSTDFHPFLPQDPNVPEESDFNLFGRDLAPMRSTYVYNGLIAAGDWLTKALDVQGYRLDYPKGVSTDYVRAYFDAGAMAGKYVVGEFFDYDVNKVSNWVWNGTGGRCSAFDFPLRGLLKEMCNSGGFFQMWRLDHAGFVGQSPFKAATFVENHDTDNHDPVFQNKVLAYAYILTSEGYPCVFYRDYSTDPGCYGLKTGIDNLIWIHEKLAEGWTQERWKDDDVFTYERMSGAHLLVGLNDNGASARTINVQTDFGANVQLHDYSGHSEDVWTDNNGRVTIILPKNIDGKGYVCYSRAGFSGQFTVNNLSARQEFAGAQDLDIRPADNTAIQTVTRIWADAGKPISAELYYDTNAWQANTSIYLELLTPTGQTLAFNYYTNATAQGTATGGTPAVTGWYTFRVRSFNTPAANLKPKYWLIATYNPPQTFADADLLHGTLRMTKTQLVRRRGSNIWTMTLILTNESTQTIVSPLQIALANLTAGATLVNRSGVTYNGTPYAAAFTTLQPGASTTLTLQFTRSNTTPVKFQPQVYSAVF